MMSKRWVHAGVIFLAMAFALWAGYFVLRSSFILDDGSRYFSLFDDAMISMRYGWNLSHGEGLVWNAGERVEGYTNLLMVLWMSLWTSLLSKSDAVLAVQLTGIPVLLGIGGLGWLHWTELGKGGEVGASRGFAALAFMGCLLYYPLAYWTLMGMETGLLTLLLLGGSLLSLAHMRGGSLRALLAAAAVLGLAYLTRPDSAPTAALMLGVAGLLGPGDWRKRVSRVLLCLAVYLLLPLLQLAFRMGYYGSPVPLTYVLKATGMPISIRIDNGIRYSLVFLGDGRWAYVLGIIGGLLGFSKRKLFLLIPPLTLLGYQVMIGGDAWSYWRLVAPAIPFLMLLALAGMDWLLRSKMRHPMASEEAAPPLAGLTRILPLLFAAAAGLMVLAAFGADFLGAGSPGFGYVQRYLLLGSILLSFLALIARPHPTRLLVAFVLCLAVLWSLNRSFLREATLFRLPYQVEENKTHVAVALAIERYTTKDASVGVFWAGTIPYYTSSYAVDFLGRNDPHIAGLPADVSGSMGWSGMYSVPGHNKYDLEYSIGQRRPTYVQWFSWGTQDMTSTLGSQYVRVSFQGPNLTLRRDDPAVRWDLIHPDWLLEP